MAVLAQYKKRALTTKMDLSNVLLTDFMTQVNKRSEQMGKTNPEQDAADFYLGNHLWGEVQLRLAGDYTPLGQYEPFCQHYFTTATDQALRMAYYLLAIINKESRHAQPGPAYTSCTDAHGKVGAWHRANRTSVHSLMWSKPLAGATLGEYVQFIRDLYYQGKWQGGFGGKAWGAVADCLLSFVRGNTTAEMMLDTSFTLAHNNGPIFNKGMFYTHYDHKNIMMTLDVQASGQIPAYVVNEGSSWVRPSTRKFAESALPVFGAGIFSSVDWNKVGCDAKGLSKSTYKHMADAGPSKPSIPVVDKNVFAITPTQSVKIIQRKDLAA